MNRLIFLALMLLLFAILVAAMPNQRNKRDLPPEKYPQFPIKAAMTYVLPVKNAAGADVCPEGSESNGAVCVQFQEPN